MSVSSSLLFDHCLWLLLLMPCLGLILTYFTKRTKPYRKNGKIYRHDVAARVEHWPHALGTLFLLISGIIMGLSFFISFVSTSEEAVIALNVHFVAACAFLFGTFYYIGNAISEPARMKEHLPNKDVISSTMNHYGAQLGFKRAKYPKEKKYFQSENMAYVFAIFVGALMAFTGIIKSIQHSIDLPGFVVSAATLLHDIGTVAMLLFLLAHVFFAVLVPWSWKTFPSMIHGWMPEEEAKKEHPGWYEDIVSEEQKAKECVRRFSDNKSPLSRTIPYSPSSIRHSIANP